VYVAPDGSLIGVNPHPGNYAGALGDDQDDSADGFYQGGGMPYGLSAFTAMKKKTTANRRPVMPQVLPVFRSDRAIYPDSGVPIKKSFFNPVVRHLKGRV
jgi:hypothetical protein